MISQVAGKVEGNLWRADSRMLEVNHSWFRMLRMELEWIAWVLVQWNESNWELNIIYEVWRWIKLPDSQTVHSRTEFFTRFFHSAFGANLYRTILSRSCRKGKQKTITLLQILEALLITAQFLVQKKARGKNASSLSSLGRDGSPKRYRAMLILRRLNQRKVHRRFTERSLKVHRRFTRERLMTFRCTIYKSSFTFDSLPLKSLCLVSSHSLFHFLRPRLYNTDYLEAVRSFCKTLFLWIWP